MGERPAGIGSGWFRERSGGAFCKHTDRTKERHHRGPGDSVLIRAPLISYDSLEGGRPIRRERLWSESFKPIVVWLVPDQD